MGKTSLGVLVLALFALDYSVSSSPVQREITVFQFLNKASNRCVRVEEAPQKAIIAGFLRTFSCGKSPDGLIDTGTNAPAFLKFDLGKAEIRCINVRPLDMKKLPSDIFANRCDAPTAKWELGGDDAEGFGEVRLFTNTTPPSDLCMSEDTRRRTVVIDVCAEKPEQKWKRVPIRIIVG